MLVLILISSHRCKFQSTCCHTQKNTHSTKTTIKNVYYLHQNNDKNKIKQLSISYRLNYKGNQIACKHSKRWNKIEQVWECSTHKCVQLKMSTFSNMQWIKVCVIKNDDGWIIITMYTQIKAIGTDQTQQKGNDLLLCVICL